MADLEVFTGGEMLANRVAAPFVALAVKSYATQLRRNGIRDATAEAYAAAAEESIRRIRATAAGSAAVPRRADRGPSAMVDPIEVGEAAKLMGCGDRNVRDLRARGHFPSARRAGQSWQLERAEVLAHIEKRGHQ